MSAMRGNVLQNVFCSWNEEEFSATNAKLRILIHRTGHSDSIVAEFPWPRGLAGSFATQSEAKRTRFTRCEVYRSWPIQGLPDVRVTSAIGSIVLQKSSRDHAAREIRQQ
jgi:hypothetical protein